MANLQRQLKCSDCARKTLHEKPAFDMGMGCLLSILTLGLFIPLWILLDICNSSHKWRCQACGAGRR